MTLAMSGASERDSGLASGLVNTTAQVGGAFGLAVLATLAAARTDALLGAGASEAEALTAGFGLAFVAAAVLAAVAFVLAATVLRPAPSVDAGAALTPERLGPGSVEAEAA
jgi:hypothetical protein